MSGGNAYGGAVSLHIGAYSSVHSSLGDTVAAVGATVVGNVSVLLDTARFESCEAIREMNSASSFGANVYGGSFSFHVGSYAWGKSVSIGGRSTSTCGSTNASGIRVWFQNASSYNVRASTENSGGMSSGANSYGGSMSLMHIGAYCWSFGSADSKSSSSSCGTTAASEVSVHISDSSCSNCSAVSALIYDDAAIYGANSYGGCMSLMHIGAYCWSLSLGGSTSSRCEATAAIEASVHVSGALCSNCSSRTTSVDGSFGANSYGGCMSLMHVGAYCWSMSLASYSVHGHRSSSSCGATAASGVFVHVFGSSCSNCSALSTTRGGESFGASSFGGAISAAVFGAYSYSYAFGAPPGHYSFSSVNATQVSHLTVTITAATFRDVMALSGELHRMHPAPT